MELKLSPEAEEMIRSRVESGKNASCEEVIDMALLTLISHEMDEADEERVRVKFQSDLRQSLEEAERGEFFSADEVFAELREKGRMMRAEAA